MSFFANGVPEDKKVAHAATRLGPDAGQFYYYLTVRNDGNPLTWQEFRHAFVQKYENTSSRNKHLRYQL